VTSQQNGNKRPKDKYCKTKVHITIHRKRTERIDEIGKWPCIIVKKAISIKEKNHSLSTMLQITEIYFVIVNILSKS